MRARVKKGAKKKVIHEGEFLRFVRSGEWEYFERNNCSAIVIIVAMTKQKRVLFVKQFRPPVGKKVIELPAGLVNDRGLKKKESGFWSTRLLLTVTLIIPPIFSSSHTPAL